MNREYLISDEYRALLCERYTMPGWGGSGYHHADEVLRCVRHLDASSVLDYGCGRGTLGKALRNRLPPRVEFREYDPGIVGKDELPEPADFVACTDVLEHVEPDRVRATLQYLRSVARKGAFFIIALSPAREILSDGRNAHLTLRTSKWWLDELLLSGFMVTRSTMAKGLWVWCL